MAISVISIWFRVAWVVRLTNNTSNNRTKPHVRVQFRNSAVYLLSIKTYLDSEPLELDWELDLSEFDSDESDWDSDESDWDSDESDWDSDDSDDSDKSWVGSIVGSAVVWTESESESESE
jgi:hypothetical protein